MPIDPDLLIELQDIKTKLAKLEGSLIKLEDNLKIESRFRNERLARLLVPLSLVLLVWLFAGISTCSVNRQAISTSSRNQEMVDMRPKDDSSRSDSNEGSTGLEEVKKTQSSQLDPRTTHPVTVDLVVRGIMILSIMTAAACVSVVALKKDW